MSKKNAAAAAVAVQFAVPAGMVLVRSPEPGYSGTSAGVEFRSGIGFAPDDPWILAWFRQNGYAVEDGELAARAAAEQAAAEKAAAEQAAAEKVTAEKAAAEQAAAEKVTAEKAVAEKAAAEKATAKAAKEKAKTEGGK